MARCKPGKGTDALKGTDSNSEVDLTPDGPFKAFEPVVAHIKNEPGTLQFNLTQNKDDPDEIWVWQEVRSPAIIWGSAADVWQI